MAIENEFPNDKATVEWLKAQKKGTMYSYKYSWKFFLEFTDMTGNQILESRKTDKEYAWEKKTLEFEGWLVNKGLSEHCRRKISIGKHLQTTSREV